MIGLAIYSCPCALCDMCFGIGSARMARAELHMWFYLIPVSGVGEAAVGVSEAVGDEIMGGNGVEGTFQQRHDQLMK